MRKLRYHEQKLLKKVDFLNWKRDDNVREVKILRKFHIQQREDYAKYNRLCGFITKLVSQLRLLPPEDQVRVKMTQVLLSKLYQIGVTSGHPTLADLEKLPATSFCRRRLAVMLVELQFCQHLQQAVTYVEQGHIRVGPQLVTSPAFHVTREMEDHIAWAQGSSIHRHVQDFNNQLDEFELMGN
eukprot:GHVS01025902.1.p1 GENE.GHVS01025902.1~~GHVS01025902.1.p1  ORF type:complete len:184 (+),score=24.57 GHVS01025902.1:192-743(+)